MGLISLQRGLGGWVGSHAMLGASPAGNNLANEHARVATPIFTLSSVTPQPAPVTVSVDWISTRCPTACPVIDLHKKNDVSVDGVPPAPAWAPVADSATSAITASIPKTGLLVMMTFPSARPACRVPRGERLVSRHSAPPFERRGFTAESSPPVWR